MSFLKYIIAIILIPFVLTICYYIGLTAVSPLLEKKNDFKKNTNNDTWIHRIIYIIIGFILILIINKIMEGTGCSSNEDKHYRM
jgi:amino acid transporter